MLDPAERSELVQLDTIKCTQSLTHFTEKAWHIVEPGRAFVPGWHIDAISEHLTAVINGEIRNLLINIPPRHMKSISVAVMFPAWAWLLKPELRWLFASYAESLSIRDSVKCRRVIQSPWYQERFGKIYQLNGDQNQKQKYENNKTGHRLATSVGGAGTGEGGDIIVADDPHKVSEAESDTVREKVLEWWDGEMSSRGNDPKTVSKIIVMQRVHQNDLSGHTLAQGGYEHLMLPAEYEPERKIFTSIGWEDPRREQGELLWPERFGAPEVERAKKEMGSMKAAGQLQQRPAPREGNIFKRQHFQFYKEKPANLDFIALSVDLPFSEGKTNSYAVFQVWGRRKAEKFLLDQSRAQCGFTVQIQMLKQILAKWMAPEMNPLKNVHAKWIEKKANGAAMLSVLEKEIPGLVPVTPIGSKEARAEAVQPQFEAGNIWLPDPSIAPWIGDYIEEMVIFNNGEFNDQVDTTTQAISKLSEGAVTDWKPVSLTGTSKWLR